MEGLYQRSNFLKLKVLSFFSEALAPGKYGVLQPCHVMSLPTELIMNICTVVTYMRYEK